MAGKCKYGPKKAKEDTKLLDGLLGTLRGVYAGPILSQATSFKVERQGEDYLCRSAGWTLLLDRRCRVLSLEIPRAKLEHRYEMQPTPEGYLVERVRSSLQGGALRLDTKLSYEDRRGVRCLSRAQVQVVHKEGEYSIEFNLSAIDIVRSR